MKRALVLIAVVPVLLLAACGGDDEEGEAGDSTTAGSVSGGTSVDGEADEYCAALSGYKAATDAADPVLASDDATPEELETAFASLNDHLDPMLETAPEEISADLELVVGKSRELIDALAANDYDLAVVGEDPANAELLASLDSAEYTEATERIDDYGEVTCDIRIDEG